MNDSQPFCHEPVCCHVMIQCARKPLNNHLMHTVHIHIVPKHYQPVLLSITTFNQLFSVRVDKPARPILFHLRKTHITYNFEWTRRWRRWRCAILHGRRCGCIHCSTAAAAGPRRIQRCGGHRRRCRQSSTALQFGFCPHQFDDKAIRLRCCQCHATCAKMARCSLRLQIQWYAWLFAMVRDEMVRNGIADG